MKFWEKSGKCDRFHTFLRLPSRYYSDTNTNTRRSADENANTRISLHVDSSRCGTCLATQTHTIKPTPRKSDRRKAVTRRIRLHKLAPLKPRRLANHQKGVSMSYSDNLITDELCLIVITDGSGDQCGSSYLTRCEILRRALTSATGGYDEALYLVRTASSWMRKRGCLSKTKPADVRQAETEAAHIVLNHYKAHLTDI